MASPNARPSFSRVLIQASAAIYTRVRCAGAKALVAARAPRRRWIVDLPRRWRFERGRLEAHRVGVDGLTGRTDVAPGAHNAWVLPGDQSGGADAAATRRADVAREDGARGKAPAIALSVVGGDVRLEYRQRRGVWIRAEKCDVWYSPPTFRYLCASAARRQNHAPPPKKRWRRSVAECRSDAVKAHTEEGRKLADCHKRRTRRQMKMPRRRINTWTPQNTGEDTSPNWTRYMGPRLTGRLWCTRWGSQC